MERYVLLDNVNTYLDWGLILTEKKIGQPDPKTYYVELDGMDGSIDLTQALTGEIAYKNRSISLSFWTDRGKREDRVELLNVIRARLHGKEIKIVEPDNPDKFLRSRLTIKEEKNYAAYAELDVEGTCEPYYYALEEKTRTMQLEKDRTTKMVINNKGRKIVLPEIIVSGKINIKNGETTIELTDGNYKIPAIRLQPGNNVITVSGEGRIKMRYREGFL